MHVAEHQAGLTVLDSFLNISLSIQNEQIPDVMKTPWIPSHDTCRVCSMDLSFQEAILVIRANMFNVKVARKLLE
jgi:hypothetical protein